MPVGWSGDVITTGTPRAAATAAMRSSSVATSTSRSFFARRAPSITCASIGRPAISANGLPGNREARKRAGMIPTADMASHDS